MSVTKNKPSYTAASLISCGAVQTVCLLQTCCPSARSSFFLTKKKNKIYKMKLLTLVIAVATAHPVSRHVGLWTKPPERCPSSMVTDGYVDKRLEFYRKRDRLRLGFRYYLLHLFFVVSAWLSVRAAPSALWAPRARSGPPRGERPVPSHFFY